MVIHIRSTLVVLLFAQAICLSSAFHMHKIMAAALLANSLQRNTYLPIPIPIPIPVKAGGNTILLPTNDNDVDLTYIPMKSGCSRPPCYSGGVHARRIDFW